MSEITRLLKVVEVSEILSISPKTIYGWHHRGKHLQFIKVGSGLRIDEDDLQRFIKENRSKKRQMKRRNSN